MNTWFKSALAAVCTGALGLSASAANVGDEMSSQYGNVVKTQLSGQNISTVTVANGTLFSSDRDLSTDISTDQGRNTRWFINAKIQVPAYVKADDLYAGNVKGRAWKNNDVDFTEVKIKPGTTKFDGGFQVENNADNGFTVTIATSFKVADLRNELKGTYKTQFKLDVDWDMNGTYESRYILDVDAGALVLSDRQDSERHSYVAWDTNAVNQVRLPAERATENLVIEGTKVTVKGDIKKALTNLAFIADNKFEHKLAQNAAMKVSDMYDHDLTTTDSFVKRGNAFNNNIYPSYANWEGLEDVFVGGKTNVMSIASDDKLLNYCEMAAIQGTNYEFYIEFDMNGDGTFEPANKFTFVFDRTSVCRAGRKVANLGGFQIVQDFGNVNTGKVSQAVGVWNISYKGDAIEFPFVEGKTNEVWNAPVQMTFPTWSSAVSGPYNQTITPAVLISNKAAYYTWSQKSYFELEAGNNKTLVVVSWNFDPFSLYLWLDGKFKQDQGMAYPCTVGTGKYDTTIAYLWDVGTNNCTIVNDRGFNACAIALDSTMKSADDAQWTYTFKVLAPKWIITDNLANQVVTLNPGVVSPVWEKVGERYLFTVTASFTLADVAGETAFKTLNIKWAEKAPNAADVITPVALTAPTKLVYNNGKTAWPLEKAAAKIRVCDKEFGADENGLVTVTNLTITLDADRKANIMEEVLLPAMIIDENKDYFGASWTNKTSGGPAKAITSADFGSTSGKFTFENAIWLINYLNLNNKANVFEGADTFENTLFSNLIDTLNVKVDATTFQFRFADGTEAYPIKDLTDWAFTNKIDDADWCATEIKAGTTIEKIGEQDGAKAKLVATFDASTPSWDLFWLTAKRPAAINANNVAEVKVNGTPATWDGDKLKLKVSINIADYTKAYYNSANKITKEYKIQWSPFYDAVTYTVELDITGSTFKKDGQPIVLGKTDDATYTADGLFVQDGANNFKFGGAYTFSYGEVLANDLTLGTLVVTGATSVIEANFPGLAKEGRILEKEGSRYVSKLTVYFNLMAVKKGLKGEGVKFGSYDWNWNGTFEDAEKYTYSYDLTQISLTNANGIVVFPWTKTNAQLMQWKDKNSQKLNQDEFACDGTKMTVSATTLVNTNLDWQGGAVVSPAFCYNGAITDKGHWIATTITKPAIADSLIAAAEIECRVNGFPMAENTGKTKFMDAFHSEKLDGCDVNGALLFFNVTTNDLTQAVINGYTSYDIVYSVKWNGYDAETYTISIDLSELNHVNLADQPWETKKVTKIFKSWNGLKGLPYEKITTNEVQYTVFDTVTLAPENDPNGKFKFMGWQDSADAATYTEVSARKQHKFADREFTTTWAPYALQVGDKKFLFDEINSGAKISDAFKNVGKNTVKLWDSDGSRFVRLDMPQEITVDDVTLDLNGVSLCIDYWLVVSAKNFVITNSVNNDACVRLMPNAHIYVSDGGTMKLAANLVGEEDAGISVNGGKLEVASSVTLNVKADAGGYNSDYSEGIWIWGESSELLVNGGRISNTATVVDGLIPAAVGVRGGKLTLTNAVICCENGIGVSSINTNSVVEIESGSVIKDCRSAVVAVAGQLTINGGTFVANGGKCEWDVSKASDYYIATGDAVVIAKDAKATINAGTFEAVNGAAIAAYDWAGQDEYPVLAQSEGFRFKAQLPVVATALYNANEYEIEKLDDTYTTFYVRNVYQVAYNLTDATTTPAAVGAFTNDVKTTYNVEDTEVLPTPLAEGWLFKGWYISDDLAVTNFEDVVAYLRATNYPATITLNAKFISLTKEYDVTFDVNTLEGTKSPVVAPENWKRTIESADTDLPDLTREGYTFLGWTTADGTRYTQIKNGDYFEDGLALVAQWKLHECTVDYVGAFDNEPNLVKTYSIEEPIEFPTDMMRDGYDFVKWTPANTVGKYNDDGYELEVTATWQDKITGKEVSGNETSADTLGAFDPAKALKYYGFVIDDGMVMGSVEISAAKANTRTGLSSVRTTAKVLGERSSTVINSVAAGAEAGQYEAANLNDTISLDNENVYGERTFAALPLTKVTKRNYTLSLIGDTARITLRIAMNANGRATVNAVLPDATKFSATVQAIAGKDGQILLPIAYLKYYSQYLVYGGFAALVAIDETTGAVELEKDTTATLATVDLGNLSYYSFDTEAGAACATSKLAEGASVVYTVGEDSATGTVQKAGTIKFLDPTNPKKTLTGVSLTYTYSTGMISGSFRVIPADGAKAVTATVTGVMVDGKEGFGIATYTYNKVKSFLQVSVEVQ